MKFKMFLVLSVVVLSAVCPVMAKQIYVDQTGNGDFTSIQAAFDDENTVDGDELVLASQIFTENLIIGTKRVSIYSADLSDGGAIIEPVLDSRSPVIMIGEIPSSDPLVPGTVIKDLTIRNGLSEYGAGILVSGVSISLINCNIMSNRSSGDSSMAMGGGVTLAMSSDSEIVDCKFYGNSSACKAGALCIMCSKNVKVTNCMFDANFAEQGGAVFCEMGTEAYFKDCRFTLNQADTGGAFKNEYALEYDYEDLPEGYELPEGTPVCYYERSEVNFYNCKFSGNMTDVAGAAIYSLYCHNIFVNCEFDNNIVSIDNSKACGGAMYLERNDTQLSNCVFLNNEANSDGYNAYGGAIYNVDTSPKITNCTFMRNRANSTGGGRGYGGAMYNTDASCPVIANSVFRLNASGDEVVNNSDDDIPEFWSCLVYNSGGSGENWKTSLGVDKGGNVDAYPYFISDTDLRLRALSNCIDAGRTEMAPRDILDIDEDGDIIEWLPIDLDGNTRFSNSIRIADTGIKSFSSLIAIDMGAYEYQDFSGAGGIPGDIDSSGKVDFADFVILADNWLSGVE